MIQKLCRKMLYTDIIETKISNIILMLINRKLTIFIVCIIYYIASLYCSVSHPNLRGRFVMKVFKSWEVWVS